MSAHKTVQTPLPLAGAMGITRYLLPWLSLRGIGVVEGLMIVSLSFSQIAFLVIRQPSLFDQNLLGGFFQLSRLFLASPIASVILGGLVHRLSRHGRRPSGQGVARAMEHPADAYVNWDRCWSRTG